MPATMDQGTTPEVLLTVTGMTCTHCTARVTRLLLALPGVKDAVVQLPSSATVYGTVAVETVIASIEAAGFGAALLPSADTSTCTVLRVAGMMCGHCTSKVEQALKAVDGVKSVMVDLNEGGRAVVVGSASVSALITAVEATGKQASLLQDASSESLSRKVKELGL